MSEPAAPSAPAPRVVLYTAITGGYDAAPEVPAEEGVEYLLFTDDPASAPPPPWRPVPLGNPEGLGPRRLSRLPKLRPHRYLPPHDLSIYIDPNVQIKAPLRALAVAAMRWRPIAIPPHPATRCLYREAEKCVRLERDDPRVVREQVARYRRAGFPEDYGLSENSFIVRRDCAETRALGELWQREHSAGSERDQLSLMYCLWRLGLGLHLLRHDARDNAFYRVLPHKAPRAEKPRFRHRLHPRHPDALQAMLAQLPAGARMLEIRPGFGLSTEVFARSGRFREILCVQGTGEPARFHPQFLELKAAHPGLIRARGPAGRIGPAEVENQSLDYIYLSNAYAAAAGAVREDLRAWRRKLRPGGVIAGSSYYEPGPQVQRAVLEELGEPDAIYPDESWCVRSPERSFGVVSYCTLGYLDALEFAVDTWLGPAGAAEVVIYTDSPQLEAKVRPRRGLSIVCAFPPGAESCAESWRRKIDAIELYFGRTSHGRFAYLDCDCWVREAFVEVFDAMADAELGATRLLARTRAGEGHANAGVIFFRHSPRLAGFFPLWRSRMRGYEQAGDVRFCEQKAFSDLLVESFDGRHPFRAALFSERIYNSEDDSEAAWLEQIERFQPKILHFKKGRFRSVETREAAFARLRGPERDGPFCGQVVPMEAEPLPSVPAEAESRRKRLP